MDYQKHYEQLCERAKSRLIEGYTERHHVIPRCMGGTDQPDNLVDLTPEEHYVAHQLLVKMYPGNRGLAHSAYMMTVGSEKAPRKNKLYGWLRKKHSKAAKQRTGEKNGSYGRSWYHHPGTLENIKCLPDEAPENFLKGRKFKKIENNKCSVCSSDTGSVGANFCPLHRKERFRDILSTNRRQPNPKSVKENHKTSLEKIRSKHNQFRKSPEYRKAKAKKLFEEFKKEDVSLRKFAIRRNITPMTLSNLFREFVSEYRKNSIPRTKFKVR